MKLKWVDILLILLGLFIAYQLLRAILGGSWQTESLIIALLMFNLGLTWKLSIGFERLNMKFEGHISWHKSVESRNEK
ncbi:MAG: hypothetical protein KKA64_03375 [Nanoarchaeota archaeon]|nr:hypothetical protein [Nanoarchaeota archaeon]